MRKTKLIVIVRSMTEYDNNGGKLDHHTQIYIDAYQEPWLLRL